MKEGWSKSRIIDITRKMFAGGDVPKQAFSKCKTDVYTIPIYANGAENDGLYGYTNEAKVSEPAVTISGRGTIGYVSKRRTPFCPVVRLITLIPNEDIISLDYLYYALYALDYSHSGSSIPQLTVPMVKEIEVSYPCLCEQKRIVERLDSAFENIDKLKANAEKQLSEAQTLFQKSLAKAMEPKEGWEEKTLKEIVLTITDGDHQPPPKSNEGIPFITISNINKDSNKIDFEDTFYVPQHYFDGLKTDRIPQEGDVLYTVTGSFGIPVLIDYKKDFCFQRHIALIRPNQKMLFSKYLYYWILSDYAKVQAEDTATGAAQRTVSLNSLRKFRISIPPLTVQQRIVERLDSLSENVRKYEEIQRQIISECDALKQALLRKVFE